MIATQSTASVGVISSAPSILELLDVLRTDLARAISDTALDVQQAAFRALTEIAQVAPVTDMVVVALYRARQACLAYLRDLEKGWTSTEKRRVALIAVDLLEAALITGDGQRLPM
jgi:hypothetical protein